MATVQHLGFSKFQNFSSQLGWVNMDHRTKLATYELSKRLVATGSAVRGMLVVISWRCRSLSWTVRHDTCVQLSRFNARPDGPSDWQCRRCCRRLWPRQRRRTCHIEQSARIAHRTHDIRQQLSDLSNRRASTNHGLVGMHNVRGHNRVLIVPGGPGLLWPSSVAFHCDLLSARHRASPLT